MKLNVEWLVTERCNLKCEYCGLCNNTIPETSEDKLKNFIKKIKVLQKYNSFEFFLFGGEPFLHPNFDFILKTLNNFKINYIVQTNGVLYDKIISLNQKYNFKFKISIHPSQITDKYIKNLSQIINKIDINNLISIDFMFLSKDNLSLYFYIKKLFKNTILCPISNFLTTGFDESLKEYNNLFREHLYNNKYQDIIFEKIFIKPKNNYRSFIWEEELYNKIPLKTCLLNNGALYDKFILFNSNLESFNCCFHDNVDINNCKYTKCFYS